MMQKIGGDVVAVVVVAAVVVVVVVVAGDDDEQQLQQRLRRHLSQPPQLGYLWPGPEQRTAQRQRIQQNRRQPLNA